MKIVLWTILIVIIVGVVSVGAFIITLLGEIPDVHTIENLHIAQSTIIYDREGNTLYTVHGEENRKYVPLSDMATYVKEATIAIEDKDFYKHAGVDVTGMIRSALYNILHPGDKLRSGSTITQQLVKNIFLTPEQTLRRKLKEIILAYQLEQTYSKDKILELYLNQIPYGSNAYGIEMAAQTFFGKSAKDVSLIEAAVLTSLPKGPSYFSPYGQNKDELMGYCKTEKEDITLTPEFGSNTEKSDSITLHLKTDTKLWLRYNLDEGKERKEITLKAGEERDFTAEQSIGFLLGNTRNVTLSYKGFTFKSLVNKGFVVTVNNVRDFLENPSALDAALLEESQQQKKNMCTNIDDTNYVDGRKDIVLRAMLREGYITKEQMDQAWQEGQKIMFKKYVANIKYPHFVMYVKDYLEDKYGQEVVEKGGLQVTTTLDPTLQDLGQSIIDKNIEKLEKQYKMSNLAMLSANPKTGQILAMIGSRDYWNEKYDGNVNITLSRRQPGSSFKPFTYAAAFQQGYGAGTVLWDVRTQFGQGAPPNNADGSFLGPMTIRKALAWSRNIPAIKAYYLAKEEDVILDFLSPFGFGYLKTNRDEARKLNPNYSYGWPMAIGSVEVRLFDMVQGFSVFARGGIKKNLTPILEIRDKDGNIIEQYNEQDNGTQILDPQIAYLINNILSDSEARPSGYWRDRITIPKYPVAVKTGTSNKRINKNLILPSDNITIGYTPSLITAFWGGNSDGSPMTGTAFDINTIAVLWKSFMSEALKNTEPESFIVPEGIVHLAINKLSGKRVSQDTPETFRTTDIFPSFGVPKEYDASILMVKVDSRNNMLATEECPPAVVQEKYVLNLHEVIDQPGWDSAINAWVKNHTDMFPNIIIDIPKENSPLCIQLPDEQKPTIAIVSPLSYGQIMRGSVNVVVDVSAYFGVEKVEYYIDNSPDPVYIARESPYVGIVSFSAQVPLDSVHRIRAVVYDKNQFTAETTIEVKITDSDTSPPHVVFVAPKDGTSIPLDSSILFETQAYDDNSSIEKVEYYIGNALVTTATKSPYRTTIYLSSGKYAEGPIIVVAKAYDIHGNSEQTSVGLILIPPVDTQNSFDILEPLSGSVLAKGSTIPIRFVVKGKSIKAIDILAKRDDGVYTTIESIKELSEQSETFTVSWTPMVSASYELYLKVLDTRGELSYSNRISIKIQ